MDRLESAYGGLNFEPHWYALTTRYHHERKVNEQLQQKGVNSYLPLCSTCHQWSDRKKKIVEPLFSCYVFVKIALKERLPVLQTDGAIRLVSFNHVPVPIPDWQIDSIRQLLREEILVEKATCWRAGQHVEVIAGPLEGVQGILQKIKNRSKLIIAIEALRQAVAVEIDACLVRPSSSIRTASSPRATQSKEYIPISD
jgi:transcription antitermination factor NusG